MILADTHTHLFDQAFDQDREQAIERALNEGVRYMFMPAVDHTSEQALFNLVRSHPDCCFAMAGFHPTSVNEFADDLDDHLNHISDLLATPPQGIQFCAVGEIGLDLYWSKDFLEEQIKALRFQFDLAIKYDLPVVIHTRDAWEPMCAEILSYKGRGLRGIMHGFSGSYEDYVKIREAGDFLFGIGGPITYKKAPQAAVIERMDLNDIVLETDAPYLSPVPFRGKRNESSYIPIICQKVAELMGKSVTQVASTTTASALRMLLPNK